jgi:hypothetical protein
MFITDRVLDIILKAKDQAHALAVASLQNEIIGLKRTATLLEEKLKYESARADGLVDRLLVRDARVAAVAPSAVAAAVHKDAESVKVLSKIFDEINLTGVDLPPSEQRAVDVAGGTAVSAGAHSGGY